jgi:hypothetical protein
VPLSEREVDKPAELVLVDAAHHGGHEDRAQLALGQHVDQAKLEAEEVAAAQRAIRRVVETVELQIDRRIVGGDRVEERRVFGQPDAVGI